jgi:FAD/FMN-containing dehydrogenase
VTVQAGMTIGELNDILAERHLALPVLGTITKQTVSGAISTATHGGSIYYGSLSDYVESVSIIRADGSIVDIDRTQELFAAVIASMGLLGVISTVTFRCVPSFVLQSRSSVKKAEQVIEDFDSLTRRSLYTCMFYFPVTDEIEILSIDKVEDGRVDIFAKTERKSSQQPKSIFKTKVGDRFAAAGLKSFAWVLRRHHSIQRFFTKFSVGSTYRTCTGRSDLVLAFSDYFGGSGRSRRMIKDMEIAVPYEQAGLALSAIRKHFLTTHKYPLIPIHIRCSARSDLWLSPAYNRDVCYIEFWQYPHSHTLFKEIHELLEPFHYRFHWGKETKASPDYIRRQYEKWDDFVRLRRDWDPKGLFLNPYLESFFT